LLQIVDIQVKEVIDRVTEKSFQLELTQDAKQFLLHTGSSEEYGARPLRRAVQQYIEDPLAELLLQGNLESGAKIEVCPSESGEKLKFKVTARAAEGVAI